MTRRFAPRSKQHYSDGKKGKSTGCRERLAIFVGGGALVVMGCAHSYNDTADVVTEPIFAAKLVNTTAGHDSACDHHNHTLVDNWRSRPTFVDNMEKLADAYHQGDLGEGKAACPCCGWHGAFEDLKPYSGLPHRGCPICGTAERHRHVCGLLGAGSLRKTESASNRSWFVPQRPYADTGPPFRLVHFGPHQRMEAGLHRVIGLDQVGVDKHMPGYKYSSNVLNADVTSISLPNNFADGILIFHVLEHIAKLDKAMQELRRILVKNKDRSSGWMLVEVPCKNMGGGGHRDCRELKTDAERIACAGQKDHVWKLDCDAFHDDLRRNGWNCYEVGSDPADYGFGADFMKTWLVRKVPLFACTADSIKHDEVIKV